MKYDKQGRELPDDTPVEVPLRFRGHAGNEDILQAMLVRLREEQEKEAEESIGEFNGEEPVELFDLPTRYELDHDAEERALLYSENAERIRLQRRAAEKENHETRSDGKREKGDRDRAGRDGGKLGPAGRETDGAADREGSVSEDD